MAFDYIWQITPNSAGAPDNVRHDVWVDLDRGDSQTVAFGLASGEVPVKSRTARLRWRPGVSTRSVLRSPDGNLWAVQDVREVGRRRFIDLSVTTVDVQTGIDTPQVASPDPNWKLVDASGDAIQSVPASRLARNHDFFNDPYTGYVGSAEGIRIFLSEEPDWAFLGAWDHAARIAIEIGGVDSWLEFRTDDAGGILNAGSFNPTEIADTNNIDSATESSARDYFFRQSGRSSVVARDSACGRLVRMGRCGCGPRDKTPAPTTGNWRLRADLPYGAKWQQRSQSKCPA